MHATTILLAVLVAGATGTGTSGAAAATATNAGTMRAYVATAPNSAQQGYDAAFGPVPAIGDLHITYADLPSSCEVKIKVEASSVNPSDIHPTVASAVLPHVMGSDVSGTIVASGGGACTRLKVGDNVWGDIGANTLAKRDGSKTKELGGYGQYAVALEAQLGTMPSNIGCAEAGALPKVSLTSYKALAWYGGAPWSRPNVSVLVLGGSGGCGSTTISLGTCGRRSAMRRRAGEP